MHDYYRFRYRITAGTRAGAGFALRAWISGLGIPFLALVMLAELPALVLAAVPLFFVFFLLGQLAQVWLRACCLIIAFIASIVVLASLFGIAAGLAGLERWPNASLYAVPTLFLAYCGAVLRSAVWHFRFGEPARPKPIRSGSSRREALWALLHLTLVVLGVALGALAGHGFAHLSGAWPIGGADDLTGYLLAAGILAVAGGWAADFAAGKLLSSLRTRTHRAICRPTGSSAAQD